jgi:hypothetical protein
MINLSVGRRRVVDATTNSFAAAAGDTFVRAVGAYMYSQLAPHPIPVPPKRPPAAAKKPLVRLDEQLNITVFANAFVSVTRLYLPKAGQTGRRAGAIAYCMERDQYAVGHCSLQANDVNLNTCKFRLACMASPRIGKCTVVKNKFQEEGLISDRYVEHIQHHMSSVHKPR